MLGHFKWFGIHVVGIFIHNFRKTIRYDEINSLCLRNVYFLGDDYDYNDI